MKIKAIELPELALGKGTWVEMIVFSQVYGSKSFEREAVPASRPLAGETAMRAGATGHPSTQQETYAWKSL